MVEDIDIQIAKVMFILAYDASIPAGLGWLHERNDVTGEQIWNQVYKSDTLFSADYISGRMVKLTLHIDVNGKVDFLEEYPLNPSYQSWCHKYPTIKALYEAALERILETPAEKAIS